MKGSKKVGRIKRSGSLNGLKILVLGLFTLVILMGCGQKEPADKSGQNRIPDQTIKVSGAWALYPMMVKWGEEYSKVHPKARVDISAGGAGKGVADALSNLVDVGMVSREMNPEEIKKGAFFIPVVKDAVFSTVNEANPVLAKGLAVKGVKKTAFIELWINGRAFTWGEIAGADSKDRVQLYTRSDSCGAAETWAQYLGGKRQEDLKGVGVYGDPGLAEAVRKDVLGTGYNNLNYCYDTKTGQPLQGLQIIPIDVNENGRVDPGELLATKGQAIQAVVSGSYPAPPARDLYLVTKERFKGPAKEFIRWILTEGQAFVDEMGYIKIKEAQVNDALKRIENE